ncbi:MAG: right-handed parallel beta-helix repeat-containing protein [Candidatus Thorarchaeota archaeon]|jgi:parallel beta-helix repeat protein
MTRTCVSLILVAAFVIVTFPIGRSTGSPGVLDVRRGNRFQTAQVFIESEPILVNGDDEFVNGPWNGSGTAEDPYLITGLAISSRAISIEITGTRAHFVISNCSLDGNGGLQSQGIAFFDVVNGRVQNVEITRMDYGVAVSDSENCTITNVTIIDSTWGLQLAHTNRTAVTRSRFYRNIFGMNLDDTLECSIVENTVYRNEDFGVRMESDARNCSAFNNTIGWNGVFRPNRIDASDNGTFNMWYNETENLGNRWSEYLGVGVYSINGTAGSIDRYPSPWFDFRRPTIDSPEDLRLEEGDIPGTILWTPSDEYPSDFQVFLDGNPVVTDTWNGRSVNVTAPPIRVGAYNYTIRVEDAAGNFAIDTVYVVVILPMFGGLGTTQIVVSSGLSVLAVVVVIVLIKKMR